MNYKILQFKWIKMSKSKWVKLKLASGCYSLQKRGVKLNLRIVRDSVNVRNVAECEFECSKARQFVCQTFHFKSSATLVTTRLAIK